MVWDLGTLVPLTVTIRDTAGVAVDAATVTLTVTLPDRTPVTVPTVSLTHTVGTGVYSYNFPTTQAGLHYYRWTSTAPSSPYSDVFDVRAAAQNILSLADAKAQLNITATTSDEELRAYVEAATRAVEGMVGPVVARQYTERVYPRGDSLVLSRRPVLSVDTVAAVYVGGLSYAAASLILDGNTGIVTHPSGLAFAGPLAVTYTAGRAQVAPNISLAGRIILQHLWSTQRGGSSRPGMGAGGGFDAVEQQLALQGFAIPRRAVELLAPDMQTGLA